MGKAVHDVWTELKIAGYSFPYPQDVIYEGPFSAIGSITDNATTAVDLTLAAAFAQDAQMALQLGFTTNDPKIMMLVQGFRLILNLTAETATPNLGFDLAKCLYLEHTHGKKTRYIQLRQNVIDNARFIQNPAGITSTLMDLGYMSLRNPVLVDFQNDVFSIAPMVAVNTAANVPFNLVLYGAAWQSGSMSYDDFVDNCIDARDAAQAQIDILSAARIDAGLRSR
jgi:hypothetical protein